MEGPLERTHGERGGRRGVARYVEASLLVLLAEQPAHGWELSERLGEVFPLPTRAGVAWSTSSPRPDGISSPSGRRSSKKSRPASCAYFSTSNEGAANDPERALREASLLWRDHSGRNPYRAFGSMGGAVDGS